MSHTLTIINPFLPPTRPVVDDNLILITGFCPVFPPGRDTE
jgi:hypothetical protein